MEIRRFGSVLVVLASLLSTGLCIDSFSYPGDSTKNQYNYTSKTYNHSLNAAWKFGDTQQFIWSTSQVGGVRLRLWQWNKTDNSEVLCANCSGTFTWGGRPIDALINENPVYYVAIYNASSALLASSQYFNMTEKETTTTTSKVTSSPTSSPTGTAGGADSATNTPTPTNTIIASSKSNDGEKIGIGVGVGVGVAAIIGAAIFFFMRSRNKKNTAPAIDNPPPMQDSHAGMMSPGMNSAMNSPGIAGAGLYGHYDPKAPIGPQELHSGQYYQPVAQDVNNGGMYIKSELPNTQVQPQFIAELPAQQGPSHGMPTNGNEPKSIPPSRGA
ncbi:hypothetical protein BGZ60DRAFT_435974 [Tricladium varicosporioides]|nr:hypothetical protein BGZ60DRAFT_435974 [Hymenoscyphus varicosporioides]